MIKYFVKDLNTIEEAASLDIALETANYWMELQRPLVEDADDDTLTRWMRSPDMGLESGDVQVFEVEMLDEDWNDLSADYSGQDFCERAIDGKRPINILSGKQQIIDEFEKRGLRFK